MPKNSLIQIDKIPGEQSVEISIDLGFYVNAYREYIESKANNMAPELIQFYEGIYKKLRMQLAAKFSDFGSIELWQTVYTKITDNNNLTDINQYDATKHSAANEIMSDNGFSEIFKNVIDKKIDAILNAPSSNNNAVAKLRVTLDDQTNPECVSFVFKDEGKGFPPHILNLDSKDSREEYLFTRGSQKSDLNNKVTPYLGGRGMGLRQLIAKIDTGGNLEPNGTISDFYSPPEQANIVFKNHTDSDGSVKGTLLTITTAKKPLELLERRDSSYTEQTDEEEDDWFILPSESLSRGKSSPTSINTNFSDSTDSDDTENENTPRSSNH